MCCVLCVVLCFVVLCCVVLCDVRGAFGVVCGVAGVECRALCVVCCVSVL